MAIHLPTLIRSRFQAKPATLLILIHLLISSLWSRSFMVFSIQVASFCQSMWFFFFTACVVLLLSNAVNTFAACCKFCSKWRARRGSILGFVMTSLQRFEKLFRRVHCCQPAPRPSQWSSLLQTFWSRKPKGLPQPR